MESAEPARERRPHRRAHTDEYKVRILDEYDAAAERGEGNAVLRREGLYTSHLTKWRRAREAGLLSINGAPAPATTPAALERENARLRAQVEKLSKQLETTNTVLDIVGKASGLLRKISDQQEPPTSSSKS